jgi:hypothetical protein
MAKRGRKPKATLANVDSKEAKTASTSFKEVTFSMDFQPLTDDEEESRFPEHLNVRLYGDYEAKRGARILRKATGATTNTESIKILLRKLCQASPVK